MGNKGSRKKTANPFARKRRSKKTLPEFGILEFYYYHLLLRVEEFEEIVYSRGRQIEDFDYRNIVSILFTIIPDHDLNVENAHNFRFSEEGPTAIELFIETLYLVAWTGSESPETNSLITTRSYFTDKRSIWHSCS